MTDAVLQPQDCCADNEATDNGRAGKWNPAVQINRIMGQPLEIDRCLECPVRTLYVNAYLYVDEDKVDEFLKIFRGYMRK